MHGGLWAKNGIITANYNNIIQDKTHRYLWQPVDRKFMNNQGTRGNDELKPYQAQCATEVVSISIFRVTFFCYVPKGATEVKYRNAF